MRLNAIAGQRNIEKPFRLPAIRRYDQSNVNKNAKSRLSTKIHLQYERFML
jgi:hypothetical protein